MRSGSMTKFYERKPNSERTEFRTVANTMLIPVVEFDRDFLLVYANPAALSLLKIDETKLNEGVHVVDLVIPEQHDLVHEGLSLLDSDVKPTSLSLRIITSRSVATPCQVYADRVTTNGKVTGFVAYVVDLSRREVVEEKILSRKDILEFMVDYYSFSGIIIVDDKFKFEYVNDKLCDILGRRRSEILGHDFREFLHPDSVDIVSERYQKRQQGDEVPSVYELKVLRKDGEVRDIRLNVGAIRGRDGNIRTVAQLLDITEEKMNAQALEDSEHRYRNLVETMDSGLSVDNTEGRIVLVNNALCRMLGYDNPEKLLGKKISSILHGWTENNINQKMAERKAGKMEHYEATLRSTTYAHVWRYCTCNDFSFPAV